MMIHTTFAAEQSSALHALVTGFMEEAQTGTAIWEDVDVDTFARFAQFIYTGDYPPPSCNAIKEPPAVPLEDAPLKQPTTPPPQEPELDSSRYYGIDSSHLRSRKRRKKRQQLDDHAGFHDRVYKVPTFAVANNRRLRCVPSSRI